MKRLVAPLLAAAMLVSACGGGAAGADRPREVIVPDTTRVLDAVTRDSIVEVTEETIRFAGTTSQLDRVEVGDVVVSEPSDAAPYGFLRTVTSLRPEPDGMVLVTGPAALEDAIAQGDFAVDHPFHADDVVLRPAVPDAMMGTRPGDLRLDGVPDGGVDVCPQPDYVDPQGGYVVCPSDPDDDGSLVIQLGWEGEVADGVRVRAEIAAGLHASMWGSITDFRVDRFGARLGGSQHVEIALDAAGNPDIDAKITLGSVSAGKQTIFIGPVPVVYEPKVDIVLQVKGGVDLQAQVSFTLAQAASAQVGFEYRRGEGWHNLSGVDLYHEADRTDVDAATARLQPALSPQAVIELYGGIASIGVAGRAYAEMDVERERDPYWLLSGGMAVDVIAKIKLVLKLPGISDVPVVGRWTRVTIFEQGWSATVVDERVEVLRATAPGAEPLRPRQQIDPDRRAAPPDEAPTVTVISPRDGDEFVRGTPVTLRAGWSDPDDPGDCDQLQWTSDVTGDPLPVSGCEVEVRFASNGPRTLTATAADASIHPGRVRVVVVDPPGYPSAQVTRPLDGQLISAPGPVELHTTARDPLGGGLDYQWSVTYPYDPATGVGETTEPVSAPGNIWQFGDTFDYCALQGRPVLLTLEVTDIAGNTGSDSVLLRTVRCLN